MGVAAPGSEIAFTNTDPKSSVEIGWSLPNGGAVSTGFGFRLTKRELAVNLTGAGRVESAPAGISCGTTCSALFDYGASAQLTALPTADWQFRGWAGACEGQGRTCTLTLTTARSTDAIFEPKSSSPQPQPQPQPRPQPQPQQQQQPAHDTTVRADVLGHKLERSLLGLRLVRIELELDERLAATAKLTRGSKALLTKRVALPGLGRRLVTLVLPQRIGKGPARLVLELRDADGNTRSWSRSVLIGRSGK